MTLVNAKSYTETPDNWRDVIRNSRIKPSPLTVINCATDVKFETWADFLSGLYVKKCPMPTRPIRILKVDQKEARFVLYKANYFGSYLKSVFVRNQGTENKKSRKSNKQSDPKVLRELYNGKLHIKHAKLKDRLH